MKYFNFATGLTMTNERFSKLFGQKVRDPNKELLTQFHMDIASSIQAVIEKIILKIITSIQKETKIKNLCLAGGVALNCVANGKILKNILKFVDTAVLICWIFRRRISVLAPRTFTIKKSNESINKIMIIFRSRIDNLYVEKINESWSKI